MEKIKFTSLASGSKIKPGQDYKMSAVIEGTDEEVEVKFTGKVRFILLQKLLRKLEFMWLLHIYLEIQIIELI